jgi:uncharacterized protein YchJ
MTRKPRKRRQQATKKAEKGRSEKSPLPTVGKGITQVKGAALFDRPPLHFSTALYTQVETRQQMDAATRPSADTGFMAHKKKMPGPYDPCHCGSGNKYKKCHMTADRAGSGTP